MYDTLKCTLNNKAYKFKLYPTKEQAILLSKTFGCVRFIYNKMLGDKISHYEKTKIPTLWTNSYFITTVGDGATIEAIKQYIQNQKTSQRN